MTHVYKHVVSGSDLVKTQISIHLKEKKKKEKKRDCQTHIILQKGTPDSNFSFKLNEPHEFNYFRHTQIFNSKIFTTDK